MHDDATAPGERGTHGAPLSSGDPGRSTAPAADLSDSRTPGARPARATRKQVLLRLDPAVHDAVARWAADDLRSVNAQIEVLLRDALKRSGRQPRDAGPLPRRGRPPGDVGT